MSSLWISCRFIITLTLCCLCYFPMNNFRYSQKRTYIGLWAFTGLIVMLNIFIMLKTGNETLSGILIFSVGIPYFILILFLTEGPGAQRIFNFWLWINIYSIIMTLVGLFKYFFLKDYISEIIVIIIFFSGYFFLYQYFLKPKHHRIMRELKINWWIVSFIPILFTIAFRNICILPGPLSKNPQNMPKAIMLNILMISVYALIFHTFKTAAEIATKKQEAQDLEVQLDLQKRHYTEMANKKQEEYIFRHDAKHRDMLLLSLIESQEIEKIKKVLRKDIASIGEMVEIIYTENMMINSVLTEYINRAKKKGLKLNLDIKLIKVSAVYETELCVMLSNLLENAVYASHSFLEIVIKQVNHQLSINVKNDYITPIKLDQDGNYISTKENGSGLGLKSVKMMLEKNGGFLQIEDDGIVFSVYASLKNE